MEEQINVIQTGLNRRPTLDIPWIRLWEKKERVRPTDDPQKRMINIDFLTMLEELEFH
jgi:hypothetical protein